MNNIAIFASGSGSNAENIVRYFYGSTLINKVIIITDNPLAYVIQRATKLNVEYKIIERSDLNNGNLLNYLFSQKINFIVLAGFLRLIPPAVIDAFPNKIVNIHPALLPKYGGKGMYGLNVHQAVIEAQEAESGITIHYVNSNYDEGSIIFQVKCPVISCDRPETLADRIHELEHEHFPRVIERLLRNL
jgi:phosphoribosylglycinamide formyltransferase-1